MANRVESINQWFGRRARGLIRWRWVILAFIGALLVVSAFGMRNLYIDNSNESYIVKNDSMMLAMKRFEEIFGNDEFLYLLVEAPDVFSPDVLHLMRVLGKDIEDQVPFAGKAVSLATIEHVEGAEGLILIRDLVGRIIPTDSSAIESIRAKALADPIYAGKIVSRDSRLAGILVSLKPMPPSTKGAADPRKTIPPALYRILKNPVYKGFNIHTIGIPIMDYETDTLMLREMKKFSLLALGVGIVVMFLFLRSFMGVLAPCLVMVSTLIIMLGFQGWLDIPITMLSSILPTLIMIVGSCYSIHLISFFQERFRITGSRSEALTFSLYHAGWPCLFTALTTAAGFASFIVVKIKPVKEMGILISLAVLVTYLMIMLIIPAMLSLGHNRLVEESATSEAKGGKRMDAYLSWLSGFVEQRQRLILAVSCVVVLVFGIAVSRIRVETDYLGTLGPDVPFVKDVRYVSDRMGGLYSSEILIDTGKEDGVKDPEVLKALDGLESFCRSYPTTALTFSLVPIVKSLEQVLDGGRPSSYRIPETREKIAEDLLMYEMAGGGSAEDWVDYSYRYLRLSVQTSYTKSEEMGQQFREIEAYAGRTFPQGIQVTVTGGMPLMIRMANYVTSGQISSALSAFLIIMLQMMAVFASFRIGLVAMYPNILPVVVVVGVMALAGIPLDLMTMMISSIIIGVAVDDTIHFVNHFRQEFRRTGSYAEANRQTFHFLGRAITMTSLILMAGFLVLSFSEIRSVRTFSLLSALAIFVALVSEYFITPVLLMRYRLFGQEEKSLPGFHRHVA